MALEAHDRIEFFYGRHTIWFGSIFLVVAVPLTVGMIGDCLGFWNVEFEGAAFEKIYGPYIGIAVGAYAIFGGITYLLIGFDRRPVVVLDHEGLFYRPHGDVIPWNDLQAVEVNTKDDHNDIILDRFSGPAVTIDVRVLCGYGKEGPIYTAIMQGWQRYRGGGKSWHVYAES